VNLDSLDDDEKVLINYYRSVSKVQKKMLMIAGEAYASLEKQKNIPKTATVIPFKSAK
jgi:hypothetical protein